MREKLHFVIVGTGVDLDAMGLPASLKGDIYLPESGPEPENRIGRYSEDVQPILDPDLRGTIGVSRLELPGGAIITENYSRIAGATPDGAILVRSAGRVTGGEGRFQSARGRISTESRVRLQPFQMRTDLTLDLGPASGAGSRSRRRARARSSTRWRRGSHPLASW